MISIYEALSEEELKRHQNRIKELENDPAYLKLHERFYNASSPQTQHVDKALISHGRDRINMAKDDLHMARTSSAYNDRPTLMGKLLKNYAGSMKEQDERYAHRSAAEAAQKLHDYSKTPPKPSDNTKQINSSISMGPSKK